MILEILNYDFSVCKVKNYSVVNLNSKFCFIGKTDEENSLVCITEEAPENTIFRDDDWKAFRVQGVLDFSLIGILSKISTLLSKNEIAIFAISTYNTDYVLTKSKDFPRAIEVLSENGFTVI